MEGIPAAALRAPRHHRLCCGGRRGISEAPGAEQAFLLRGRSGWEGPDLGPGLLCELFSTGIVKTNEPYFLTVSKK